MGHKLVQALDPRLDVSELKEDDVRAHVARELQPKMLTALAVAGYKRRLGAASGQALSNDKRIARQAAFALFGAIQVVEPQHEWLDCKRLVTLEHRQLAATVKWELWLPATAAICNEQARLCATWVMRMNLGSAIVRQLFTRLDNAAERLAGIALVEA